VAAFASLLAAVGLVKVSQKVGAEDSPTPGSCAGKATTDGGSNV